MQVPSEHSQSNAGYTLLELISLVAVMIIIMAAMVVGLQTEAGDLGELATDSQRQRSASAVLRRIEAAVDRAAGTSATAWLAEDVESDNATLQVDSSAGFPPVGTLLLEPGTVREERVSYTGLNTTTHTFTGLIRGTRCTTSSGHESGARVHWAGSASALENQIGPAHALWDGQALTADGPLFFRGDGTGLSFRVPTDPAGGTDLFEAAAIGWGSKVNGTPSANGWSALKFAPTKRIVEADVQTDINGDGDRFDSFDLGQIRLLRWDSIANDQPISDVALCPPIVAQEVCNFGGDMDGDGFDDPIFLWNTDDGSLRIRLTLVSGKQNQRPVVQRLSSNIYLRNGSI